MLAALYATWIMRGKKQYSEVPQFLKPEVKEILEDEGVGYLVDE